jgi:hypothetical protein
MATRLKAAVKAGGSASRPATLAPQARRLLEGPVLPTLLRLATLMACGLTSYSAVMVAVMRRELGLLPERS